MSLTVEMAGITKDFGPVRALDSVDFAVEAGTIHALVGENGAGKTTLMRVLYGQLTPDAGTIEVEGRVGRFHGAADAIAAGIGMVSQHYSVIPELTCLENLMLGAEPGLWIRHADAAARADELAARMGFEFDWKSEARSLSPAGAQKLEILKLLWREARIMVLDEPTAMLSPDDSDALYASLKQLSAAGATVIVVTHRIPEVLEHCRSVTVLRGGRKVADLEVAQTDCKSLAEWIVGHELSSEEVAEPVLGLPTLEVRGLRVLGERGEEALKGVDLTVRAGEVVGIAGVDGNGQRELFRALLGIARPIAGEMSLMGRSLAGVPPAERLELGLSLIPEDRHEEGVVDDWPLEWNAALGRQRNEELRRGPWIDRGGRAALAERVADRFATRHAGLDQPMCSLSGGNQQRFVAARALAGEPKLLLAFQPTRGLDIDGTRQVYEAIRRTCREGGAAVVVSFDLDELLEQCDRVVAINHGRIYAPPADQARDRGAIGRLMVGAQA